jgi:HK97 family phage major capsid protein
MAVKVQFRKAELSIEDAEKRLTEIEAEMKELDSEAGDGDLDEEQRSTWEELDGEHNELALATRKAKRGERLRVSRAKWDSIQVGGRKDDPWEGDVRVIPERQALSRARQVVDNKEIGGHLRADQKEHLDKLLRTRNASMDGDVLARLLLATQDPHYRSAFQKYASNSQAFTSEEATAIEVVRQTKRALSIGGSAGADGGFAVPVLIDPTIIMTAQGSVNDILRLARVETITTNEWKGVSSAGVTWKFDAEAAEATDNSPSVAQPTVTTKRADGFIPFSIEIGMDWPGFAEQMSGLLSEGYNELLADKLTTGTSANSPSGLIAKLVTITNSRVPLDTAATIQGSDIYGLWAALPQRFRRQPNTAWMSSTDVQNTIRQLGTVDPNFSVDITQEAIPRLFGREYPMNDYMADVPASGTGLQPLLVVGDFRGYVVAQRAGMTVEFIPMLMGSNNRPTGERGWFAWARVGANVVNPAGFRLLRNKS